MIGSLYCVILAIFIAGVMMYYNANDPHEVHTFELLMIDIGCNISAMFLFAVLLYTAFTKDRSNDKRYD